MLIIGVRIPGFTRQSIPDTLGPEKDHVHTPP